MKNIIIDRTKLFKPEFLGPNWVIASQDKRSLALNQINLTDVLLKLMLKEGETHISGGTNLKRLKLTNDIRLDAKILFTLLENQALIPEEWKKATNGAVTNIYFDGTIIHDPHGYNDTWMINHRRTLFLYWIDRPGQWSWSMDLLRDHRYIYERSAVLEV